MIDRIISVVALIVSIIALYMTNEYIRWDDKQQYGVCVDYDVNTVGTTVESAVMDGNILTCSSGTYVPAIPTEK